ncbi:NADH-ubiquinone oxidoreductase 39-40 kDa subunit [Neokomagataea thailandica NBRC 106555]|nr:NADH-ubiquinone oxidoreductase 39-40 kDa subunit [Neokomagataea thailandica NBRC 106555]
MIYGAHGENNVQRLAKLLRYLPLVPLPNGGKMLVQPIEQSDITRSIISAIELIKGQHITKAETIIIAGKKAVTYKDFVHMICTEAGLSRKPVINVPASLLARIAYFTRYIPIIPTIFPEEVRRLSEDKAFDITAMERRLKFTPLSLEEGLKRFSNIRNL